MAFARVRIPLNASKYVPVVKLCFSKYVRNNKTTQTTAEQSRCAVLYFGSSALSVFDKNLCVFFLPAGSSCIKTEHLNMFAYRVHLCQEAIVHCFVARPVLTGSHSSHSVAEASCFRYVNLLNVFRSSFLHFYWAVWLSPASFGTIRGYTLDNPRGVFDSVTLDVVFQ